MSSEGTGFSETHDFRICSLGNVDSGKSTLVGCLTRGLLDDGRGKARSYVLKHAHEQKRGQTSSVATQLLGYKADGSQVMPTTTTAEQARKSHTKDFYEVATKSVRRVTLVDLCGHEKYLKSSIYGLTALNPHCAMVVIGAERGIQKMTREHMGLCCALRIPFFIVLTKIDMAPPDVMKDTQTRIKRLLKRAGRKAFHVREMGEVEGAVKCLSKGQVGFAPVFEVSCVTGESLDFLREFVKQLSTSQIKPIIDFQEDKVVKDEDTENKDSDDNIVITPVSGESGTHDPVVSTSCQFVIDDVFNVPGVGIVLGGNLHRGTIQNGQKLFVGPDKGGEFRQVIVRSIYRQCVPSKIVFSGQHATLAVKNVGKGALKREMFRKGMVAGGIDDVEKMKSATVFEFEADVKVLHHSTTIDRGYSPFIHMAGTRQSARIVQITSIENGEEVVARTGSQVLIRFRFLHAPEYMQIGCPLIFREGNAKGCGRVTRLFDQDGNVVQL